MMKFYLLLLLVNITNKIPYFSFPHSPIFFPLRRNNWRDAHNFHLKLLRKEQM